MNLSTLKRIARDCQAERHDCARPQDWAFRLYDRLLNRWPKAPLPFRKKACPVYKKGVSEPFFLRLGSSDWRVLHQLYIENEYDTLLKYDLGKPQLIVDLGSNIGLSLRLWREHFPDARVLAVEPDANNMRILRMNYPEGESGKAILVQACVLGHVRSVQLEKGAGEWGYSVKDATSDVQDSQNTIAAFTMPDLLQRHLSGAVIDLSKCDIEGTEAELFRNCGAWLRKVRFALVELHGNYKLNDFEHDVGESGVPIEVLWNEEGFDYSFVIFRNREADCNRN
jgi:FkbM family methyltransferase